MIYCVLVTYNPNYSKLLVTLQSLLSQVDVIIIVKNSNELFAIPKDVSFNTNIYVIQLEKNMGIAYAQNRGVEYALSQDAKYILFSDQDTVYPKDFIKKVFNCFERNKAEKIAAVVPLFYNDNKKQYAKLSIKKNKAISPVLGKDYFLAQSISSGTVCPVSVISDIGLMNERLFIDWVDTEWCWRITSLGYKIVCDTNNVIYHSMGDSFKTVFGKKIVIYSDFRNYYFFRNGTYLLFHSHLLNIFEWFGLLKFMIQKSILYFLTCGFSYAHIKLFVRSIRKGISNHFTLGNS